MSGGFVIGNGQLFQTKFGTGSNKTNIEDKINGCKSSYS